MPRSQLVSRRAATLGTAAALAAGAMLATTGTAIAGSSADPHASATATSHATDGTAGTTGDVGSAQPLSNADQNTGGANGQCIGGAYCSTRHGLASGNGNGGGQATGKPCAGCVGRADNKNPHGQMPNATDLNNGHECDGNHGIARGNPAHTSCLPALPPPPACIPTAENHNCGTPGETGGSGGSGGGGGGSGGGGTSGGGTSGGSTAGGSTTTVMGTQFSRTPAQTAVAGASTSRAPSTSVLGTSSTLPFTGMPTGALLGLATALLALGATCLYGASRRRTGEA